MTERRALQKCRDQFAHYVLEHREKATKAIEAGHYELAAMSLTKAATNQKFVDLANEALAETRGFDVAEEPAE